MYQKINVETSIFICSLPEHGLAEPRDSRHVAAARVVKFKDYITKVIVCDRYPADLNYTQSTLAIHFYICTVQKWIPDLTVPIFFVVKLFIILIC